MNNLSRYHAHLRKAALEALSGGVFHPDPWARSHRLADYEAVAAIEGPAAPAPGYVGRVGSWRSPIPSASSGASRTTSH